MQERAWSGFAKRSCSRLDAILSERDLPAPGFPLILFFALARTGKTVQQHGLPGQMIGYFDPSTLVIGENEARINFVNAMDGRDVRECRMHTAEEVRGIIAGLKDQLENGVTGLLGRYRRVEGVFQSVPGHPTEGIVTAADKSRIPVQLNFDVNPGDLPEQGVCIAMGEMYKGALVASSISIVPMAQEADPEPVPKEN